MDRCIPIKDLRQMLQRASEGLSKVLQNCVDMNVK